MTKSKVTVKSETFNVFDGKVIHTIKEKELTKFLKRFNTAVAVSFWSEEVRAVKNRIPMKPKAKKIVAKTTVKAKNATKKIVAIKNNRKQTFNSIAECSKKLHIDDSNISKVLKGKRQSANGFKFQYK